MMQLCAIDGALSRLFGREDETDGTDTAKFAVLGVDDDTWSCPMIARFGFTIFIYMHKINN